MGYTIEFNLPAEKTDPLLNALIGNFASVNHFSMYRGHGMCDSDSETLSVTLSSENYQLVQEIVKINELQIKNDGTETEPTSLADVHTIVTEAATEAHKAAMKHLVNLLEKRGFEVFTTQPPMTCDELDQHIQQIRNPKVSTAQNPIMFCFAGHTLPGPFDFPVTDKTARTGGGSD